MGKADFLTDTAGEITKKDLDKAREFARDIDKPDNKIKAIVSVMILLEGWDVRNVSLVLGLRPFTAKAEILPEQVIGRGLRLMVATNPEARDNLPGGGATKVRHRHPHHHHQAPADAQRPQAGDA